VITWPRFGQFHNHSAGISAGLIVSTRGKLGLKGDLAIRPIYHQTTSRSKPTILVAFLVYCPQVTLQQGLRVA
jgi:hypothetical protein